MRIIGGTLRGRPLSFNDAEGLRPTADRIRETLFNWLQWRIARARVLDLFAGSGALGFEAFSRGAAAVVLVERHPQTVKVLQGNAAVLGADQQQLQVVQADAHAWLGRTPDAPFDIVFLDPPFHQHLLQPAIDRLKQAGWLHDKALIYIEQAVDEPPPQVPAHWHVRKLKRAGQVRYQLLEVELATRANNDTQ